MNEQQIIGPGFVNEIRTLIEKSRQNIAVSVNAEITMLYWQIGKRIGIEVLQNSRAAYGKFIMKSLSVQLISDFGQGWSEKHLRHCFRFYEVFNDDQIVSTLWRKLNMLMLKA